MSEENVQIALQQIDAFNRRDVEGVVASASPEVEWEDSMFWTEPVRIYRGRAVSSRFSQLSAEGRPGAAVGGPSSV
jgi:hypothetical protein